MLRATEYDRQVDPTSPRTVRARPATFPDLWCIAVGHAHASCRRAPRLVRILWPVAAVATALRLLGPTGRHEVWTTGAGTSVVVTPVPPAGTPARVAALTTAAWLGTLVVAPATVSAATIAIGGHVTLAGPAIAIGWLLALLVTSTSPVMRTRTGTAVTLVRPGTSGRTVRLHDLARHPADPPGTGTGLLAAMLTDAYLSDRVTAVAATGGLARRYIAAGMTRQQPVPASQGAA